MVLAKLEELSDGPTRSVDWFEKLDLIGVGAHGQVFKAREKQTGEIVALKKISMKDGKEVLPDACVREITILKKLDHRNVIKLKEIVISVVGGHEKDENNNREGNKFNGDIYLVLEYMDHDLRGLLISYGPKFTVPQIKILEGIDYLHTQNVLHLDIKGDNILLDDNGTLKLADFGFATSFSSDRNETFSSRVMTLWFKPPEILLGSVRYGPEVDMWSVGCVFGGILNGKTILTGENETDQLNRIFDLCGPPDEINWPGVSKLPSYNSLMRSMPMKRRVREMFKNVATDGLDLLDNLLTLDPSKRWTAKQALESDYFSNDPPPSNPESLPKYESSHGDIVRMKILKQLQEKETAKRQEILQMPQQQQQPPPPLSHGSPNHLANNPPPTSLAVPSYYYDQGLPVASYWYPPGLIGGYNSNLGLQAGYHSQVPYAPHVHWVAPYSGVPVLPVGFPSGGPSGHGVGRNTWHRGSISGGRVGDCGRRRNTCDRGSARGGGRGVDNGAGRHRGSSNGGRG